ncbi:MAG: S41 family peptidase [Prochlorotrichaceae cyanobacterium]
MINQPLFATACKTLLVLSSSVAFLAPAVMAPQPSFAQDGILWENSPKETLDQSWQIVYREYVDPSFNHTDWLQSRETLLTKDYDSPESAYSALRSALNQLEDPYTRFLDPEQYQALTNQTRGELSGVGMRLRRDEQSNRIMVEEAMFNSPALKAGIQSGDVILEINGQSTLGMEVSTAAELIRGEVGTQVTLRYSRQEKTLESTLTREQIEVPSVSYTRRQEGTRKIGYIRLSQFTSHAAREMRDAIRTLNPEVDGFVLDLRGNPGGLLNSSIDIARMWLDEGTIVKTTDRENRDLELKANSTALTKLPLVVLVDQNSASSSEILAGALQDNRRGIIVGRQTFGKALVQSLHALEDGSGIAVTIAHYYTPNGTDISKRGLTPDVAVNLNQEQQISLARNPEQLGTQGDPQYVEAIELLETLLSARPQEAQLSERF